MHNKAVLVLADDNSLGQAGGHDRLIAQKNFLTCTCIKMLIEEKELNLRQELYIVLLVRHCMMSDNHIKMLDPVVQPLKPSNQTVSHKNKLIITVRLKFIEEDNNLEALLHKSKIGTTATQNNISATKHKGQLELESKQIKVTEDKKQKEIPNTQALCEEATNKNNPFGILQEEPEEIEEEKDKRQYKS